MNKVLERQLKRVFGNIESVPQQIYPLLAIISETYDHNEEDRLMIERSMDLSSKELGELNKKLQSESGNLKTKLDELERMNKLMVDRELKMIELKKEIEALRAGRS